MPKCANVVALVVVTNILTIAIFTSFRNSVTRNEILQPLPQPGQLNQVVQTGRVIQAVMEKEPNSIDLFEKRQERIDSYCAYKKEHPSGPFTNDPSKLFVLKDRHLVWCPVFKAGSSTWLSTLVDLSSKSKVKIFLNTCINMLIRAQCLKITDKVLIGNYLITVRQRIHQTTQR